MLDKPKATKTRAHGELAKNTLAKWDDRGMKLNNVTDMEIKFGIHVKAYKIYSSIKLNSVPYEAVDLAFKVVKSNKSFDLIELQLSQLGKTWRAFGHLRKMCISLALSLYVYFSMCKSYFHPRALWFRVRIDQSFIKSMIL